MIESKLTLNGLNLTLSKLTLHGLNLTLSKLVQDGLNFTVSKLTQDGLNLTDSKLTHDVLNLTLKIETGYVNLAYLLHSSTYFPCFFLLHFLKKSNFGNLKILSD